MLASGFVDSIHQVVGKNRLDFPVDPENHHIAVCS